MELSGLVLCGGQSRRMGFDKGLLLHNDQPWSKHIVDILSKIVPDVFVSLRVDQGVDQGGADRESAYRHIFNASQMIFDRDEIPAKGPLKGLLSAHKTYPGKNWIVLGCDMMSVNRETISGLKTAFHKNPGYDRYLYKTQYGLEPLCAIYSKKGLEKLLGNVQNISDFSLRRNFDAKKCLCIEANKETVAALKNYNTMADSGVK
jgi:molybdopterin-guanine dinucleotide biosynthesis protein A